MQALGAILAQYLGRHGKKGIVIRSHLHRLVQG